jgi:cell cycle arrest protein BUB2
MTQRSKPCWNSSTSIHSKRVVKETKPPQYHHRPRDPYLPTPSRDPNIKRSLSVSSSICSLEQEEFQFSAMTPEEKIQGFEQLLTSKNHSDRELRESLRILRRMIMLYGLPESKTNSDTKIATLRGKIWKVLLGVYKVSALEYIKIVEKGPCQVMDKIKNDTFRTCATDKQFVDRVSQEMLSRVLNAFVWKAKEQPPSRLINLSFSYVQGMNVMAAPFLYVLPELDAFFTFSTFVQNSCPLYVQPALEGAHCGVKVTIRLVNGSVTGHVHESG